MTVEKKKIMIMDDEEVVGDIAKQMLEYLGYEVDLVTDGEAAIDLYQRELEKGSPFSLIIMDLNIPEGVGGQEAIEKILTIDPKAKALVSSGYTTDPIMEKYSEYGFSGTIAKPFDLEGLKQSIKAVLE